VGQVSVTMPGQFSVATNTPTHHMILPPQPLLLKKWLFKPNVEKLKIFIDK
jgi:hypothetical protein